MILFILLSGTNCLQIFVFIGRPPFAGTTDSKILQAVERG